MTHRLRWLVLLALPLGTAGFTCGSASDRVTPPTVTVEYTETAPHAGVQASTQLQVATAFPGSLLPVPVGSNTNVMGRPFDGQFAASGSDLYAVLSGPSPTVAVDVFAADNGGTNFNGTTFDGPTAYPIVPNLACASIAVDPVDSELVYLSYLAGTNNGGETLRLAVSTDGAKSFPTEYDLVDDESSLASFACSSVAAVGQDAVIVAGYSSLVPDGSANHMATFVSTMQGRGIGPVSQTGVPIGDDAELGNDTNASSHTDCNIASNGGNGGPRIAANGGSMTCIFSTYRDCPDPSQDGVTVQCSANKGSTWTTPITVAQPVEFTTAFPNGSVSESGNIAVTWMDNVAEDGGAEGEVFIAISKDGGHTFGTPKQYPTALRLADGGGDAGYPVVAWENDDVLWLLQTVTVGNENFTFIDKTCDDGTTWSGPVNLGAYQNSSLLRTTLGMVAGVYALGTGGGVYAIPLSELP